MAAKFKVRADVFHYFVMVVVGAGGTYAFTRFYGESDEVKENNLVCDIMFTNFTQDSQQHRLYTSRSNTACQIPSTS